MEEIDKKIQNLELIVALRVLQENNTPENRNRMINEMMKSKFITPAMIDEAEQARVKENQEKGIKSPINVSFKVVNTKDGKKFLPAFTDTVQMNLWKEKSGITDNLKNMVMNFDVYAQYVMNSKGNLAGFIINPFGENIAFNEDLIKNLVMQRLQHLKAAAAKKAQDENPQKPDQTLLS